MARADLAGVAAPAKLQPATVKTDRLAQARLINERVKRMLVSFCGSPALILRVVGDGVVIKKAGLGRRLATP
jgi:hypothetical protein